jgi:NADH-quinone oxidoreductase subunit M
MDFTSYVITNYRFDCYNNFHRLKMNTKMQKRFTLICSWHLLWLELLATDGLLYYIFWELALIPIYFIALIWGNGDAESVKKQ